MVFSRRQQSYGECESDYTDDADRFDSDDSQTDPTYDITEGIRSKLSSLSMKKKSKPRLDKEMIENVEEPDIMQVVGPEQVELDQKDQKSYETVEERVKAGQLEKLKVDQCKVYLRKHGLRLTGNKDILIQRIREHLDILDGGGEKKYPASSFVVNCKGDACAGDVVLFEQNVYEMFNIASRSASGAPCGTRLVAGKIVKESYGAAKQQHTFTVEVLWSKGVKPLSPLHQLLIKGRNLYRLKTMRQEWEDETERKKKLFEKHARGSVARSNREARVQVRVLRKMRKGHGTLEAEKQKKQIPSFLPIPSNNMAQPPQLADETLNNFRHPNLKPMDGMEITSCKDKSSVTPGGPVSVHTRPVFSLDDAVPLESDHLKRQPLTSMNRSLPGNRPTTATDEARLFKKAMNFVHKAPNHGNNNPSRRPPRAGPGGGDISNAHAHNLNVYSSRGKNIIAPRNPVEGHLQEKQQPCRYYAQGRCYYGNQCKWLHEGSGDQKLSH